MRKPATGKNKPNRPVQILQGFYFRKFQGERLGFLLLLVGLLTRFVAVPMMVIMVVAILSAKYCGEVTEATIALGAALVLAFHTVWGQPWLGATSAARS